MEPYKRFKTIRKRIIIASLILLLFAQAGDYILRYFNITVDDFRIAGGIILFIYTVLGILGHIEAETITSEEVAVVPLATPLLAGPGAITVIIYLKYSMGLLITLVSLMINLAIAWLLLENGGKLLEYLGKHGSMALNKILTILLAAYSIAMIREDIIAFINIP